MTADEASETVTPPPAATLLPMMTGYWVSQALGVVAQLGIADLLEDGPRRVEDLAAETRTHAPSLGRLVRALASAGVFTEPGPGTVALTPLAEPLLSGAPGSMRSQSHRA